MSTQEYIRSITETIPDDFPTLTPLPEGSTTSSSSSKTSFFSNITWQTWVIIILVLALLGINIFAYLAKGTQETASIVGKIFGPILKLFGYGTLVTTKQIIETTATGSKAGIDIVAGATTGAIDTVQETAQNGLPVSTTGTYVGVSTTNTPSYNNTNTSNTNTSNTNTSNTNTSNNNSTNYNSNIQGVQAKSSLPVQNNIQHAGANVEQWQEGSLEKALSNAAQTANQVSPDDSRSSIQTTGKSGWCFIGEEHGLRTCSEIGANDACMSGDVFPNQAICMNPNLRA